ncbi:MAG: exosortase system-associated protein, TIGR04073 family [Candidatus Omnitrophica bacterium]|nr:exosortase system-associated protein, TIGR04073 family [Candidatus Omnitrophota bacterium]
MRRPIKIFVIILILTSFWIGASHAAGPFTKLGRGLTNLATGWIEMPLTMQRECQKQDYMTGIFYGFPAGLFRAFLRTGAGIYEIISFPFPVPNNYETIIEPEFIISSPLEETQI